MSSVEENLGALPPSSRSAVRHIGFRVLDADAEIHQMLGKLRSDLEAVVQAIQVLESMDRQRRCKDPGRTQAATPARKAGKPKKVVSIETKR